MGVRQKLGTNSRDEHAPYKQLNDHPENDIKITMTIIRSPNCARQLFLCSSSLSVRAQHVNPRIASTVASTPPKHFTKALVDAAKCGEGNGELRAKQPRK
jgi:hypothetical protein